MLMSTGLSLSEGFPRPIRLSDPRTTRVRKGSGEAARIADNMKRTRRTVEKMCYSRGGPLQGTLMNRARFLLFACLIGTTAACGSNNTVPTTPTPTTFTEVFAGTLTTNGAQTFTFISQASGTVV